MNLPPKCVGSDRPCSSHAAEVEYLLGTPHIAMRAGHLIDGVSVRAASIALVYRYWQDMLDRTVPLTLAGLVFDGLDISAIQADPSLRPHTVLANLPSELLPCKSDSGVPTLQSYETFTLRKLQVA